MQVTTADLYEVEGAFGEMADTCAITGYDSEAVPSDDQIQAILSDPDNLARNTASLIRWIKVCKQREDAERGLAEPHYEEYRRHRDNADRIEATRRRLLVKLEQMALIPSGGSWKDGTFTAFRRKTFKVRVMGYCQCPDAGHQESHWLTDDCVKFQPDTRRVPLEFLKIEAKAELLKIKQHLKAAADDELMPTPDWAKLEESYSVVIR